MPPPRAARRLVPVAVALLASARARAADYEADVRARDESDLLDLHARGAIGDATLETLLELLRNPVDPARDPPARLHALPGVTWDAIARIEAARAAGECLPDAEALARVAGLPAASAEALAPFVLARDGCPDDAPAAHDDATPPADRAWRGRAELRARHLAGSPGAPPGFVRLRAQRTPDVDLGLCLLTTRLLPGPPSYDPARAALLAAPPGYRLDLPRAFLRIRRGRVTGILGSYRAGFGERLTFDRTSRPLPDGFYADDLVTTPGDSARGCPYGASGQDACARAGLFDRRTTADYRAPEGLRGLALELRELPGPGAARTTLQAFASYHPRALYQYALRDRARCPEDGRVACPAPPVLDARDPERRFAYLTLPGVRDEWLGGGHLGLELGALRLGATGYHARVRWRLTGLDADVQPWSRLPQGDRFGALGLHAALDLGPATWFAELARSHGAQGPGGLGAVTRVLLALPGQEWELQARYYDRQFENPFARPAAAPDLVQGLAARDEAGLRLRWWWNAPRLLQVRALLELWRPAHGLTRVPPRDTSAARARVAWRVDRPGEWLRELALWGEHGGCRAPPVSAQPTADADTAASCPPDQHRLTARVAHWTRARRLSLALQHTLALRATADPGRAPPARDVSTWLDLGLRAGRALAVHLRARHLWQDPTAPSRGERSLLGVLDAGWQDADWQVRVRVATLALLDARDGTRRRRPNPEHTLQLEIERRF